MKKRFNSILEIINKYITIICMVMTSALVFILFIQVVFRYALNNALSWPDELARFLLIWITFLGAAVATWDRGHLVIDFLVNKVSKRFNKKVAIFLNIINSIFLLVAVIVSFKAVNISFGMSLVSLPLNWGQAFISLPIGFSLCFLYYINFILNRRVD